MLQNRHIDICRRIQEAGGKPYIVGGAVRDMLLGLPPKDVDIMAVGMTRENLGNAFQNEDFGLGGWVGNMFPVLLVDGIEVALARKERKSGTGYTGFECDIENVTLEEDLARRDLTINAMAMDPFTGKIIDPHGGAADLRARILRLIGPHFAEDPLRVLRAARFAAQFDMNGTRDLYVAIENIPENELRELPGERVFAELQKALRTQHPAKFFDVLDEAGVLPIFFPEIANLQGRIQPEKHHPEGCVFTHVMLVIDRARELGADEVTMFAALVHDLGKAVTPDDDLPRHINHEALGVPLVDAMCERLKIPNDFKHVGRITAREHLNVHKFFDLKTTTRVRFLDRLGAVHGNELLERVTLASQADAQGRGPLFHDKPYPQRQAILDAAKVFRQVKGDKFVGMEGQKIAAKMEQERVRALEHAGFGK